MPVEIERKFLVANDDWLAGAVRRTHLRQGYLSRSGRATVRVRIVDGREAFITVKSSNAGLSRMEFEYPVPVDDAGHLLALAQGCIIDKLRYDVPYGGLVWQVDVFAGDNAGLVVAEVELPAPDTPVSMPPWLGVEVTGDRRFYNLALAERPYRSWDRAEAASSRP